MLQNNKFEEFEVDRIFELFDGRKTFEGYVELLLEENERINLVSRETTREDLYRMIADCLVPVYMNGPYLIFFEKWVGNQNPNKAKLLDIGSGGGLPSIPLALGVGLEVTLIERTAKKADFLRRALKTLGIAGQVLNCDFREFAHNPAIKTATGSLPDGDKPVFSIATIRWVKADHAMLRKACGLLDASDVDHGLVYYSATPDCNITPDDPLERYVYSYRLVGDTRPSRTLTVFQHKST